jgi:four helix bundle protein
MKDFRNLSVWKKAHSFTLQVYNLSNSFPREEMFGLTSQLRRSAASIGANISEGCGRSSDADFARFLQIAFGSACEAEYHLLLARDLLMISPESHANLENELVEMKRMLSSLISRVKGGNKKLTAES